MSLLFSEIENKITELKINKIIPSRKRILVGIINYVQTKIDLKKGLESTFDWYFKNMNYYTTLKKKDITKRLGILK